MASQRVLLLILAGMAITAATPIAKTGCQESCGNLSIPYPFGTREGCYHDNNFLMTCNETFTTFLWNTNIMVTNISLDGQLSVSQYVARDCYNRFGTQISNNSPYVWLGEFWISDAANKFTAIGCDTYAEIQGTLQSGETYDSGCISRCSSMDAVINGSCSGIGCCQVTMPKGLRRIEVLLSSYNNHTNITNFNPCSYAFVTQEEKFNFSSQLIGGMHEEILPLVLDWAIGNVSCKIAQNSQNYACMENSECIGVDNGSGYRCKCKDGYEGNPYLFGCQDIDECVKNLHECEKECINLPGNYTCSCPKGYHGDGRKSGNRCIADQILLIKIVICTAVSVTVLVICFSWLYLGLKKRKLIILKEKFFRQNGGFLLQQQLSSREGSNEAAKIFSAEELKRATNNYDEGRVIGKGGYGTVYKGILTDNRIVAIKKSKVVDQTQIEQFINEVTVLSQINHRNVVKLVGCCLETQVPLLVYEFITNGTLSEHIHDETKSFALSWEIRLRIAAETAGVLSYLHSAASTPIIHRDVKPTNILLDHNYTAKVSDFGASRLVPLDQDELSTMVQGTLGYLDPEYMLTSQLTEKSDVYSFGVVLVELLTGKKALCFNRSVEERSLAMYFLSSLKEDRLFQVLEDHIVHEGNTDQLVEVAKLAKKCLGVKGNDRPTMKEVAMELEGLRVLQEHPWVNIDQGSQETEYLLAKTSSLKEDGDTSNISGSYDTIRKHAIFSLDGGR